MSNVIDSEYKTVLGYVCIKRVGKVRHDGEEKRVGTLIKKHHDV